jgi:hypothetical protein
MASVEQIPHKQPEFTRSTVDFGRHFVQRWDLYAQQLDNGRYICIHEPLHPEQILSHLAGEITLGAYLLDQNSQARYVVLDADDHDSFSDLFQLSQTLTQEDVPSYLESSRRGGHLWLFFDQAIPGNLARDFGRGLLDCHRVTNVELFPKQDKLVSGPGSLIRMPFGIHRLTGTRYGFITSQGELLAATLQDQIRALSAPEIVPEDMFEAYRSYAPKKHNPSVLEVSKRPGDTLSDQIKNSVTVLEFVSQYVELKPTGSGAIGLCPFHDDHKPSFSVNAQGNYWHCFAGCGGGSVIDFWTKWQGGDFKTAIKVLAQILL